MMLGVLLDRVDKESVSFLSKSSYSSSWGLPQIRLTILQASLCHHS